MIERRVRSSRDIIMIPTQERPLSHGTSNPSSENGISTYINSIQADLLTAKEEIDLANKFKSGQEARMRLLETEDESVIESLRGKIDDGSKARKRLIESNLRLVVRVAVRYVNKGVPLADLIQSGNLGLIRSIETYDPDLGFRFSTYATWWIRQSISRSLAYDAEIIRIPVHAHEAKIRLSRRASEFMQEHMREPNLKESAELAEVGVETMESMIRTSAPLSLDLGTGEDGENTLEAILADHNAEDPEDAAVRTTSSFSAEEILKYVTPRERRVLELIYGLEEGGTGEERTLGQVGSFLGLTRERIRVIRNDAFAKIRNKRI